MIYCFKLLFSIFSFVSNMSYQYKKMFHLIVFFFFQRYSTLCTVLYVLYV